MKNVSFGTILYRSQGTQCTPKQKKVIAEINNIMGEYPKDFPVYGQAGTAEKAIEENSNSDVLIIGRYDGNITLQLRKRNEKHSIQKRDGVPVSVTLNLKQSMKNIKEMIESVALQFVDYSNEFEPNEDWNF